MLLKMFFVLTSAVVCGDHMTRVPFLRRGFKDPLMRLWHSVHPTSSLES